MKIAPVMEWIPLWTMWLLLSVTESAQQNNNTEEQSAEDALYQKFFSRVRHGRPVIDASQPVTVNVTYQLHGIHVLDAEIQTITSRASITLEWVDNYITWNPDDFQGVSVIGVSIDKIWTPKSKIFNSIALHSFLAPGQMAQVSATGHVTISITDAFTTYCAMALSAFPFDRQTCRTIITDDIYHRHQVQLLTNDKVVDLRYYSENSEWFLESTAALKPTENNSSGGADSVVFSVTMRRKCITAVAGIIAPVVCLAFMSLATFGTPNQNNEKTTIGMLTFVSYVIMLTIVDDRVPLGSREVPIIVVYMATVCALLTLSVLFSNLVTKLHTYNPRARLPRKLRYALFGRLAWCLRMRHIVPDKSSYVLNHKVRKGSSFANNSAIVDNENPPEKEKVTTIRFELTQEGKIYNTLETILQELRVITRRVHSVKETEESRQEWMAAGRVVDRLCLVLFLIINIICVLAMLIIYPALHA